jgi:RHS repeat-associated protein
MSGTVSDSFIYDSFGNLANSSGSFIQPFRYTAKEHNDAETGLTYHRARYKDSNTGRFASEDPMRFRGGATSIPMLSITRYSSLIRWVSVRKEHTKQHLMKSQRHLRQLRILQERVSRTRTSYAINLLIGQLTILFPVRSHRSTTPDKLLKESDHSKRPILRQLATLHFSTGRVMLF